MEYKYIIICCLEDGTFDSIIDGIYYDYKATEAMVDKLKEEDKIQKFGHDYEYRIVGLFDQPYVFSK
jgi:hypothetical protein